MLLPQRRQPLLLGVRIDVRPNDESDDVEEGHPRLLRQELLGKRQRDRTAEPSDLHDGHEACSHRGRDLVRCTCAGDKGHGGQIDCVLDWSDLGFICQQILRDRSGAWDIRTTRLLTMICRILATRLVRPANMRCRMLIRT